jgi:hypothetical protein
VLPKVQPKFIAPQSDLGQWQVSLVSFTRNRVSTNSILEYLLYTIQHR